MEKEIKTPVSFTVITQGQNKREKAEKLAYLIGKLINIEDCVPIIQKYHKFENSYQIVFTFSLDVQNCPIEESVRKVTSLCLPWIIERVGPQNQVDLIFNKSDTSRYTLNELNTILWANWIVEK